MLADLIRSGRLEVTSGSWVTPEDTLSRLPTLVQQLVEGRPGANRMQKIPSQNRFFRIKPSHMFVAPARVWNVQRLIFKCYLAGTYQCFHCSHIARHGVRTTVLDIIV